MPRLYYNFSSFDGRQGHGYGKAQPIPSFGKGIGSERSMGYSETGIYPYVPEEEVDSDGKDFNFFGSPAAIDKFVSKVNLTRPRFDISRRADRAGFVQNQRLDLAPMGEMATMPKAMSGIVPFSPKTLYGDSGFDGPPLGSGNANQAFRTTGPYRRTGTQYGTSRAPLKTDYDDDDFILSLRDILDLSPADRAVLRQNIKIKKVIDRLD